MAGSDNSTGWNFPRYGETSNRLAGYQEAHGPLNKSQDARDDLFYVERSWNFYTVRRDEEARRIASDPHSPIFHEPRVQVWNSLIDKLNAAHLNGTAGGKLLEAQIVNGWVNTVVAYDYQEASQKDGQLPGGLYQKYQTPYETLSRGRGICVDTALLKYETLRRLGFDDKDMRLVYADIHDSKNKWIDNHTMLKVNIGGQDFVLNNQDFNPRTPFIDNRQQIFGNDGEVYTPWTMPKMTDDKGNAEQYGPLYSINEQNIRSYRLVVPQHNTRTIPNGRLNTEYDRAIDIIGQQGANDIINSAFDVAGSTLVAPSPMQKTPSPASDSRPTDPLVPSFQSRGNLNALKSHQDNAQLPSAKVVSPKPGRLLSASRQL